MALPIAHGQILRFSCSQLVVERLDPLVNPGMSPSTHLHQIIGGVRECLRTARRLLADHTQNAFNASMDTKTLDLPSAATCTSCQFADDFSNYWTAVLYFRARNGTFHRVNQKPNVGFEQATGGMTVYYSSSYNGGKVTAFKPVSLSKNRATRFRAEPCTSRDSECLSATPSKGRPPERRNTAKSHLHVCRTP